MEVGKVWVCWRRAFRMGAAWGRGGLGSLRIQAVGCAWGEALCVQTWGLLWLSRWTGVIITGVNWCSLPLLGALLWCKERNPWLFCWKSRIPVKSEFFKAWFKIPLLQMCTRYSNLEVVSDDLLYIILNFKRKREEKKTSWRIGFFKKLGHLLWNFDTNPRTLYSI